MPSANSTYKKLAVECLNEALCFVSSFVVADSLVLRNRQPPSRQAGWRATGIGDQDIDLPGSSQNFGTSGLGRDIGGNRRDLHPMCCADIGCGLRQCVDATGVQDQINPSFGQGHGTAPTQPF